jgi:trimeric autotransporter adhesin
MPVVTCHHLRRRVCIALPSVAAALLSVFLALPASHAQQRIVVARTIDAIDGLSEAVDVGPLPVSQPMRLTLRLAAAPDRQADLDQLLAVQITPSSSSYHHWLTPQQFAAKYGATDEQIVATTAWLQSQGLSIDGVSTTKTRIVVSGTADQVQRAFAVTLRAYSVSGTQHYASTVRPSMPQAVSSAIAEVSGLDDMPSPMKTRVTAISTNGLTTILSSDAVDPLDAAAAAIDANSAPILALAMSECTGSLTQPDYEAYRALFRQAAAQGITVVTSNTCDTRSAGAQTGDLSEATALITAPVALPLAAVDPRPGWQSAPGLPDDGLRHAPDLTTSSVEDFAHTMASILQQTEGGRQGNINATLYSLASTPDLYTQPDGASGTWESGTGR